MPRRCAAGTSSAPATSAAAATAAIESCANMAKKHSMIIAPPNQLLGEILVWLDGLTTPDVISAALSRIEETGEKLGEALVAMGAVTTDDVLRAVARQHSLPFLSRDELPSALPILNNV